MVETVLLRCSLVLGEVSSCIVSKIITGPQSNKSLVLGEKPVLLFKMEHSPSSSKPGLPCEKPGRSTAQSCAFCFSPWNYFAHQGQPQKERDSLCVGGCGSSATSPVQVPKSRYCYLVVGETGMLQDTRTATDSCRALQGAGAVL